MLGLIALHVIGGGFALASGAVALAVRKGGWLHRKAGKVFHPGNCSIL